MEGTEGFQQFLHLVTANLRFWMEETQDLQLRDVGELEPERQNLFRATQIALEYPQTQREAAELLLQCWLFIERRGYWPECMLLLERALVHCGDRDPALRCRLMNRLGQARRLDRQWPAAIASHEEAMRAAERLENASLVATAAYQLSSDYLEMRDFEEAEHWGLQALETFERLAPRSGDHAKVLNILGSTARWQGDFALALERYREAIACWRSLDNAGDLATTLLNLAEALQAIERFDEALPIYSEAISLMAAAGSERRVVWAKTNLAALYYRMGEYARAEATFREIDLVYLRKSGDIYFQAVVANGLGNVLLARKRLEAAESYLRQSQSFWLELDDEINLANTVGTLAEALVAQGKLKEAIHLFDEACALLAGHPEHDWARKLLDGFRKARAAVSA